MKYAIHVALIISAGINISIFLGIPFDFIKYLWLVNGLCQAILWPSLILTVSRNIEPKYTHTYKSCCFLRENSICTAPFQARFDADDPQSILC